VNATRERSLRVLTADEDADALEGLSELVRGLGHEVIARAISLQDVAEVVAAEEPDVALVVLHQDREHALDLIGEIAEYGAGPVIALLDSEDPAFIARAAEEGIAAYARPINDVTVQNAIEVALHRHAETEALSEKVEQLESALARRALIERAKGILMERHGIDERAAFELLRGHARATSRKVVDLAGSVTEGHALLPRENEGRGA
jgi:AmiR/NasT family two-component response regulator